MSTGSDGLERVKSRVVADRRSAAAVQKNLRNILCLDDFEYAAQRHLPHPLFGYASGWTERGASHRANKASFEQYAFVPDVLKDVSKRDPSRTLLGRRYAQPFGIPPIGLSAAMAYDGDVVLSRGAAAAQIPFVLSASSLTKMERVAAEGYARWYQAYLPGDEQRIAALVDRVEAAGFETLVLTADVPVASNRENNIRNGFDIPLRPTLSLAWQGIRHPKWLVSTALRTLRTTGMPHFENMDAFRGPPILSRNMLRAIGNRDQLSWRHLEFMRRRWEGSLVVKGIVAAADVRMARECGADGVIISNHGGRQLDGVIAPLHVLVQAVEVAGNMAVMLDGGVRRGTDVLKALALGASFVFVGRPFLYAAAVAGEAGVVHAIRLLSEEIGRDMALLGIRSLDQLEQRHLVRI